MLSRVYPGEKAFRLYDTFGMPLDFMQEAARDRGIPFDQAGFDRAMAEQRERSPAPPGKVVLKPNRLPSELRIIFPQFFFAGTCNNPAP